MDWLDRNNIELGYQMPIQTCWKLAQKWYKGRLERDWQRLDHENAQSVFHHLGLQGDFWNLG